MPPSRHSSSSHSSSSRSSSSRSSRSRPSSHSSSSHSSRPSARFTPPARPRANQPTGFAAATRMTPIYFYGRKHSYAYYPQSWTDADTGASFEKGYYDEDGRRYDNVAFEENGRYKSVVCHCPYCGQDTVLDLGAGEVAALSLKCEHCGGPMEITSELDAILSDAPSPDNSVSGASPEKKKTGRLWLIVMALLLVVNAGRKLLRQREPEPFGGSIQQVSVVDGGSSAVSFGNAVYLEKQSDGSYHVVNDVVRADRILYYDRDADSYHDEATDCWLWYNTEVEPAVWQYWYEGISSDYGDFGWMEHEASGWYIEASRGNWVPLPESYDVSGLWWIA